MILPSVRVSRFIGDDVKTVVRRVVLPVVHRVHRITGIGYAVCVLQPSRRVGIISSDLSTARSFLRESGFEYQCLAALKYRVAGVRGSSRRLFLQPDDGSYVLRDSKDPNKQYHVHLFQRPGGVEVTAHYEYVPYPDWSAANPLTRPIYHYCGIGTETDRGVRFVRSLLANYQRRVQVD